MLRRPEPRECRGRRSKTRKKGKLLGGAGVELAPELLGQGKKDAVENAEAVDAGMAGRAEADEEFFPRDSGPAVMNVDPFCFCFCLAADAAPAAVPLEHPAAQSAEIDEIMALRGVTGGAEAPYARFGGAAGPAAQGKLSCMSRGHG